MRTIIKLYDEQNASSYMKRFEKLTIEEKAKYFDIIAGKYFNSNYGTLSKSEIDLIMFGIYLEERLETYGDRKRVTDYELSKELGITQNRIRSLRERKELKYPTYSDEYGWERAFIDSIVDTHFDETNHRIKMVIQDVNLMIELRNFLESIGWYDEYSLNPKLLTVTPQCFVDICNKLTDGKELVFNEETINRIKEIEGIDKSAWEKFKTNRSLESFKELVEPMGKKLFCSVIKECIPGGSLATILVDMVKSSKK